MPNSERNRGPKKRSDFRNRSIARYSSEQPQRTISRRKLFPLAIGAGVALTSLGGAAVLYGQAHKDHEFSSEDAEQAVKTSVAEFNNAFGLHLPPEEEASRTHIDDSLSEYQRLIGAETTGYMPNDELNRPAITTKDKIIYLYPPALARTVELSNGQSTSNVTRDILIHELGHATSNNYTISDEYQAVLLKMFGQLPAFKGNKIEKGQTKGASVTIVVDGARRALYPNLDETEAVLLWDAVTRRNGRNPNASIVFSYERGRADMLNKVLTKMGGNYEDTIDKLMTLRMQEGGREKWADEMGKAFGIQESDRLFFANTVFLAIDRQNPDYLPTNLR